MKNKYVLLALLFVPFVGKAQVANDSIAELDELIIHENRMQIPFQQSTRNIQVITKEDIKKLPVSSINEV
ncbi:MAG: TonB-dependent receptor, partial [Myroides sp.]